MQGFLFDVCITGASRRPGADLSERPKRRRVIGPDGLVERKLQPRLGSERRLPTEDAFGVVFLDELAQALAADGEL